MKDLKYFTIDPGYIVIDKIKNGTINKEDLMKLTPLELTSLYNYDNIQQLTLLHIACISGSLEIVKLFELKDFSNFLGQGTVNYLEFIRLNDLGEDIYEYFSLNGFIDSLLLYEETNDIYKKFIEERLNYQKILDEYETFIRFNNKKNKNVKITKKIFKSNLSKIDLTKLKLEDINKLVNFEDDHYQYSTNILRLCVVYHDLETVKYLLSIGVDILIKGTKNKSIFKLSSNKEINKELIKYSLINNIKIDVYSENITEIIQEVFQETFKKL